MFIQLYVNLYLYKELAVCFSVYTVPRRDNRATLNKKIYGNLPLALLCFIVQLYFSGPLGSWIVCCLHFKIEFRSCDRGRQWCGIFHYHW